ncbi:diguanylate cyclase [Sulfurimonas lithotrophica]|uniref:diguanylate cyclase n=1 Tax=Sulfurimonas lithotrophica TaxID=2590022 RepID=A0A5P8NZ65_9BACT|nr:diguanylate cyclase [Sulfurimonas lithotrophica]QFR48627.1 diguanylate cyclase [Sulfurimonas lithotrophica]
MRNNKTILIVDDVHANMEILGSFLKDLYEVKYASDGISALKMTHTEPIPDLILLDVEMPDMNGFEVLKFLKKDSKTKNIPVIFVTGHNDIKNEERGLINGAVDYITKPISPIIVKARVNTHITLKHQQDELIFRASHDQLTEIYNRHKLVEEGNRYFSKSIRHNEDLCIAIIDVDHFKNINDTYGHMIGDEVLKAIASILHKSIRVEDIVARYGGEEFVVIFDRCTIKDAFDKANKLRMKINYANPGDIKVSASFGLTSLKHDLHRNFDHMLKEADDALYEAKESGRNKVVIYK